MFAEGTKTPFVAKIILLSVLVLNELLILLVDGVVGQMHVFVLFVDFLSVSFWGEPGETFLKHIDTQGLVACDTDIDSKIELMTVNQERIGDILGNNTGFVDVDVVYVIYNLDTTTLTPTGGLENPNIFLWFVLLELLIVIVKISEFIG
jgi:hypothetical protein